jgi:hypothetical protein
VSDPPRGPMRAWSVPLLCAALATAAQLGPVAWRLAGHRDGYFADADELFYAAVLQHVAHYPLHDTNPFDREWSRAASPFGRVLPAAAALPMRLGVPPGAWTDAARWLGSFAGAYAIVRLGAAVASPAVGAAAATIVLLDPAAYSGKAFMALAGFGRTPSGEPHQLPFSRLYSPTFLLGFWVAALVALVSLAAHPSSKRHRAWTVAAFAALGATGNFYFCAGAVGAALGLLSFHPRRRRLMPPALGAIGALALTLWVSLTGLHGADAAELGLRIGFFRTRVPQFLTHTGFWAGAVAAAWLAWGPWRLGASTRALGGAALGVWLVALAHTPLTGWDVRSYHFGLALGPVFVAAWCALAYRAWRRWGEPRPVRLAGAVAVAVTAFAGPFWAMRGLAAKLGQTEDPIPAARAWLDAGRIPPGAVVAVPRPLRWPVGAVYEGRVFAHPYLIHWSVPDTVIWERQLCAAAVTGEASADVAQLSGHHRGLPQMWSDGRPGDVSMVGVSSYSELFDRLVLREALDLERTARSADALRVACRDGPDFALAIGRTHLLRALKAGAALGAKTFWIATDSAAVWLQLNRRETSDRDPSRKPKPLRPPQQTATQPTTGAGGRRPSGSSG